MTVDQAQLQYYKDSRRNSGTLPRAFDTVTSFGDSHEAFKKKELDDFVRQAIDGDPVAAKRVLSTVAGQAALKITLEQQEKKNHSLYQHLMQQLLAAQLKQIDDMIERYQKLAEWHAAQEQIFRDKMKDIEAQLEKIEAQEDKIKALKDDPELDRAEAIRELKEAGLEVDENADDDTIRELLQHMIDDLEGQKRDLGDKHGQAQQKAEEHRMSKEEAQQMAREIIAFKKETQSLGLAAEEESRRLGAFIKEREPKLNEMYEKLEDQKLEKKVKRTVDDIQKDIVKAEPVIAFSPNQG